MGEFKLCPPPRGRYFILRIRERLGNIHPILAFVLNYH